MADGLKTGWGTWHTSTAIDRDCPQGCGRRHSVAQAVGLNEAANERRRVALRAAHERWLGKGKGPQAEA